MGLLDDAIREHLELKRRSGADPGQLDQQAKDALGPPARHEAAPLPGDEPTPRAALEDEPPVARRRPDIADDWADGEDELPAAPPPAPARAAAAPSEGSVQVPRPAAEPVADAERTRAFSLEEERAAVQPPAPPARPHRRIDAPDEDAPKDELEQTPEFLEETPEHDRLWFEQRPPKDFDF